MTVALSRGAALRAIGDEFARIAASKRGRGIVEEMQAAAEQADEAQDYGTSRQKIAANERQDAAVEDLVGEFRDDLGHLLDVLRTGSRAAA